jgi:dTDP-4-dehydrorhamnose 3,5-epimerase
MNLIPTSLPEVLLFEPKVHRDGRGFFVETWQQARYLSHGIGPQFVQDNHSRSQRGTLRGLHAQHRQPQGKLVRCIQGEIYDVAVDVRPSSSTFGKFAAATLSAENFRQLWIPPGFVHGFCVLSETAEVEYKCTTPYAPGDEIGLLWSDPEVAIPWPLGGSTPLLSAKDEKQPTLAQLRKLLGA